MRQKTIIIGWCVHTPVVIKGKKGDQPMAYTHFAVACSRRIRDLLVYVPTFFVGQKFVSALAKLKVRPKLLCMVEGELVSSVWQDKWGSWLTYLVLYASTFQVVSSATHWKVDLEKLNQVWKLESLKEMAEQIAPSIEKWKDYIYQPDLAIVSPQEVGALVRNLDDPVSRKIQQTERKRATARRLREAEESEPKD